MEHRLHACSNQQLRRRVHVQARPQLGLWRPSWRLRRRLWGRGRLPERRWRCMYLPQTPCTLTWHTGCLPHGSPACTLACWHLGAPCHPCLPGSLKTTLSAAHAASSLTCLHACRRLLQRLLSPRARRRQRLGLRRGVRPPQGHRAAAGPGCTASPFVVVNTGRSSQRPPHHVQHVSGGY